MSLADQKRKAGQLNKLLMYFLVDLYGLLTSDHIHVCAHDKFVHFLCAKLRSLMRFEGRPLYEQC